MARSMGLENRVPSQRTDPDVRRAEAEASESDPKSEIEAREKKKVMEYAPGHERTLKMAPCELADMKRSEAEPVGTQPDWVAERAVRQGVSLPASSEERLALPTRSAQDASTHVVTEDADSIPVACTKAERSKRASDLQARRHGKNLICNRTRRTISRRFEYLKELLGIPRDTSQEEALRSSIHLMHCYTSLRKDVCDP